MNCGHFNPEKADKELRGRYSLRFVDFFIQEGFKTYLFGGSLRDMAMGHEWKDADIRSWIPLPQKYRDLKAEEVLKKAGINIKSKIIFNEKFTIYRFMPKGSKAEGVIDFTVVSKQFEVIPDFTVNGLYFDLGTKELIDPYDALGDIDKKIIRTILPPDEQFTLEPHMIMRAVKCACQFGFKIEDKTLKAMKEKSALTKETFSAIADDIFPGMTEWFLGNVFRAIKYDSALFVKLWNETGLTKVFIDFISNRFGSKMTASTIPQIFQPGDKYAYEEALSMFISEVARKIDKRDAQKIFKKIVTLFRIDAPTAYGDFVVDVPNIKYWFK